MQVNCPIDGVPIALFHYSVGALDCVDDHVIVLEIEKGATL